MKNIEESKIIESSKLDIKELESKSIIDVSDSIVKPSLYNENTKSENNDSSYEELIESKKYLTFKDILTHQSTLNFWNKHFSKHK